MVKSSRKDSDRTIKSKNKKIKRRLSAKKINKHRSKKSKMNSSKISGRHKRKVKKSKTNRTIKQLFSELRKQASNQSMCNSVIVLDDTPIDPSISNQPTAKIKTIVIDDETTMFTSTPKKTKTVEEVQSTSQPNLDDSNNNKTKIINESSYQTVDLTMDGPDNDCFVTSVSSLASLSQGSSMSGDSQVTILKRPERKKSFTPSQLIRAFKNMDSKNKGNILYCLAEDIMRRNLPPRAIETAEDTYIKEVIVAKTLSRNSIGSNIYNPDKYVNRTGLRMIVVDGSNVAMAHGDNQRFSVRGLNIVIDYFLSRGHVVKAFVPRFRNKTGKSTDPQQLIRLERQGHVIFTPSREVRGRMMVSYDDRYIIQCAAEFEGIVVSNDKYSDLLLENPKWERVISHRVLPFTWCSGMIMFPRDPLGRHGPTLENFLKMPISQ